MATATEIALSKAHMLIRDIRLSGQKFGTSEIIWRHIDRLEEALAEVDRERREARLDLYREFTRKLLLWPNENRMEQSYDHEVSPAAAVVPGTLNGDAGAWVDLRVFIPAGAVGDDGGEF